MVPSRRAPQFIATKLVSIHFNMRSISKVCFIEAFFFSLSHDHLADTFILYLQCTRRLGLKYI